MAESPREGQPRGDSASAGLGDSDSRLTNSARALSLGVLLSGRRAAIDGIEKELETLGVPLTLSATRSWHERRRLLDESDGVLREVDAEFVHEREANPSGRLEARTTQPLFPEQRVALWDRLKQSNEESVAYAWLRLLMAEEDPLLVASAAGALSHWRRPGGTEDRGVPQPLIRSKGAVAILSRDPDELTSAVAQASLREAASRPRRLVRPQRETGDESGNLSLLVHGTFSFTGDWWYPGGDFHEYIASEVRSNLYSAKDTFWWSGRYKAKDRRVGAQRLAGWVEAKKKTLDTVFGHSYGGAVALHATMFGLRAETVVLLSTPVDPFEVEWRNIDRAVSLRIHCDLVLLAARSKQKFTANVEEHWLDQWFVHHDASHSPAVWSEGNWATELGLT